MSDNFLLDFLKIYDGSNSAHLNFLEELNIIYNQLPESILWDITDAWRGGRSGKSPAKLNNFIKFFNPDKINHLKTINNVNDFLNIYNPSAYSKAISTLKNSENDTRQQKNNIIEQYNNNIDIVKKTEFDEVNVNFDNLANLIESYIIKNNLPYYEKKGEFTICYVENINIFGNTDKNNPNHFNDVRVVLEFCGGAKIIGMWEATTSPGYHYTYNPMNPDGAFKIIPGWHNQCWQIGTHLTPDHPALVQTGNVVGGYRDKNKDFNYLNDIVTYGYYGINQHHGWDMPNDNIGKASAGCLVGRTKKGHFEFMDMIKKDIRYVANKNFKFSTLILPVKYLTKG